MKFLIDAHLPYQLKNWISAKGFEAVHTLDLQGKNETPDTNIIKYSMDEKWIVVSKDADFYEYFVIKQMPYKLVWITFGNLRNKQLIKLFELNFSAIILLLKNSKVIEFGNKEIITHF